MVYPSTAGNNLIVSPYGNYTFILVEDYSFKGKISGVDYTIPKGFVSDGASIPRVLWSIFGGPFCPKNLEASVQHDYLIHLNLDSDSRDLQFYSTLVSKGTSKWKAKIMYLGVVAWSKLKSFLPK